MIVITIKNAILTGMPILVLIYYAMGNNSFSFGACLRDKMNMVHAGIVLLLVAMVTVFSTKQGVVIVCE